MPGLVSVGVVGREGKKQAQKQMASVMHLSVVWNKKLLEGTCGLSEKSGNLVHRHVSDKY
jgi:hypothetical protein